MLVTAFETTSNKPAAPPPPPPVKFRFRFNPFVYPLPPLTRLMAEMTVCFITTVAPATPPPAQPVGTTQILPHVCGVQQLHPGDIFTSALRSQQVISAVDLHPPDLLSRGERRGERERALDRARWASDPVPARLGVDRRRCRGGTGGRARVEGCGQDRHPDLSPAEGSSPTVAP